MILFVYISLIINLLSNKIIVSKDGSGNFTTIQEAINAAKPKQIIFIKNGIYDGKVFIDSLKHHLTIIGESEGGVIIKIDLPRNEWRKTHNDDWGAATINVKGNHLHFENLTVINCNIPIKEIIEKKDDLTLFGGNPPSHIFAFRSFSGATPLTFKNCTFRTNGGDTVSPWDVENGNYYFKNCTIEGHVDMYCPRGTALAENCLFICHNKNASIWHDGSKNKNHKTILKNCSFIGEEGYKLGRFHKDSQFYLINCKFDENMADTDIYWESSAPKPIEWGKRVYYSNCQRKAGNYAWFNDNFSSNTKEFKAIIKKQRLINRF